MPLKPPKTCGKRSWAESMYKLVISDDEGRTTVVPLLRDEITIGRRKGNAIRLTERNVSRNHARLLRRNGKYVVEDLGSYNGVTVNGERIDTKAELSAGDQLGIGDYDLAFQADLRETTYARPSQPASRPPPRLVLLGDPAPGAEFTLTKPAVRIGRDERLDVWINHKSISHEHAEIQVRDGKTTIFDLGSANGTRINGIQASRAVLESGDIIQLGEVRLRFLPAEGAHSLAPLEEVPETTEAGSRTPKSLIALLVVGGLLATGAGAVWVTMRSAPATVPPRGADTSARRVSTGDFGAADTAESRVADSPQAVTRAPADGEGSPIPEPQEWERELVRARRALARGRFDRAYSIAQELPPDSILRQTPEFGEIRYRYVQSHIHDGERALKNGDVEQARQEAALVLGVSGVTAKQRQEARRLIRRAKGAQGRRIVD